MQSLTFDCYLKGYNFYKNIWTPDLSDKLQAKALPVSDIMLTWHFISSTRRSIYYLIISYYAQFLYQYIEGQSATVHCDVVRPMW